MNTVKLSIMENEKKETENNQQLFFKIYFIEKETNYDIVKVFI